MQIRLDAGFGHHPAYEVAQQDVGMDLLEDTGRRVRPKVLDVQPVFPLTVDRFDLPPAMIQVDEVVRAVCRRVQQRSQQPTRTESGPLVADQASHENLRKIRGFPSGSRGRVKLDGPLVVTDAPLSLGVAGLLRGHSHEEVGPTLWNTPDGRVGKKSRSPSGPDRCRESDASDVGARHAR